MAGRVRAAAARRTRGGAGAPDAARHAGPLHGGLRRARPRRASRRTGRRRAAPDRRAAPRPSGGRHPGVARARGHRRRAPVPVLEKIALDAKSDPPLRLEAMNSVRAAGDAGQDRSAARPALGPDARHSRGGDARARAPRSRRRSSARCPDSTSIATGPCAPRRRRRSASIPPSSGLPRLTLMLQDRDQRVIPARARRARRGEGAGRRSHPARASQGRRLRRPRRGRDRSRGAEGRSLRCRRSSRAIAGGRATAPTWRAPRRSARWRASTRPRRARCCEDALRIAEWAIRVRAATLLREQGVPDADPARPAHAAAARSTRPSGRCSSTRRSRRTPTSRPIAGTIEIELAILDAPLTVAQLHRAGAQGLLQRHRDPPRRPRLRRAGRRSARRRRGRSRVHDPRRDQPAALPARHRRHGARLGGHRRQPVLHHALAAAASRRALHGVRPRGERHGRRGSGCSSGTWCGGSGSGTGSRLSKRPTSQIGSSRSRTSAARSRKSGFTNHRCATATQGAPFVWRNQAAYFFFAAFFFAPLAAFFAI